ncbi:MAG: AAA family ATPase [Saccharofermentanales bacterium]
MKESIDIISRILDNIDKVIVGKRKTAELVLISLICDGHVLIEDVPGVGKTAMVSAISKSINASFKRVQFTPDVLPSDITGFSVFNQKLNEFEYRPGVIMCNILLADEINRTSPKTQSSLLEAMEENQVTVDGKTYKIPKPFFVLATQNPVEYLGTHPLPEAQMDRFFMRVSLGYPTAAEECDILVKYKTDNPIETLESVASIQDILTIQKRVKEINVDPSLNEYIVEIMNRTRNHPNVVLGASPRGSMYLYRAAQAVALLNNRAYVIPDDIKKIFIPVLSHRLTLKQEAKLKKTTTDEVLAGILSTTKVPVL